MILEYRDGRWDEVPGAITREYLSDHFGFDHGDRFDPTRERTGRSIMTRPFLPRRQRSSPRR